MLDVSDKFPWNEMEECTVDGAGDFVFIPKTYVKDAIFIDGVGGLKAPDSIRSTPHPGYHLHPMFMNSGKETPTGVLIAKYFATGTAKAPMSKADDTVFLQLPLVEAREACKTRNVVDGTEDRQGWHLYNIYEHHFLARLMLIEAEGTDIQNRIGGSPDANGVTHYGIADIWGQSGVSPYNVFLWLDGIDTLGDENHTFRIFDNHGNGTMVDTDVPWTSPGWVVSTWIVKGDDFDFGDIFIAGITSPKETKGVFGGNYQYFGGNCAYNVYCGSDRSGPFSLYCNNPADMRGFRLAKFV